MNERMIEMSARVEYIPNSVTPHFFWMFTSLISYLTFLLWNKHVDLSKDVCAFIYTGYYN